MAAAPQAVQGFRQTLSLTAAASDKTGALTAACGASRGGGVQLSGTFTATVLFEQSIDGGTTWIAKTVYPAGGGAGVTTTTANGQWKFVCGGETHIRARCSAFTAGPIQVDLALTAGVDTKAAPTAVRVDSASGAYEYETVAAGQTAQALGATGATGDYLSHVVLQPAAVGAGTTTILDNATVIFTYTTGTLGDLRPITVPINAVSVSGAWKITTGANMAATAFGDFT